jgi:hypothetical protein
MDADHSPLSRRKWLGLVSVPAVAAATFPLVARAAEATPAVPNPDGNRNDRGARVYNVRDFGAKGDGHTVDTAAVQAAIDACTGDGGGTVLVPAGTFPIGSTELKSNVTLHIAAGATLLGAADGKQYHAVDAIPLTGDSTLGDGNWSLLFAVNARNITIEGPGTIDGQGLTFHTTASGEPAPSGIDDHRRPYHFLCYRCEHVVIRGPRFLACAYHSIRVIQTKHVAIDGIYIYNRVNRNNDGFHFISAEYVTVSNCIVLCQDDACALFGSCKFITITNCTFSTRWSVFRFGGGVAENIAVSNCLIYQVFGCPIKIHCGPGSRMENMSFSNLVLQEVTGPINISVGPWRQPPRPAAEKGAVENAAKEAPKEAPPTPPRRGSEPGEGIVRNISFSHIHGTVTTNPPPLPGYPFNRSYNPGEKLSCIALNCVGGGIVEKISFDDVHLTFGGGGTAEAGARRDLPEVAGEYFMLGEMPAYGLFARNSRGLTLNNVRFQVASPELRPAVILDRVEDVAVNGLSVDGNAQGESALRFVNAKQVLLTAPRLLTATPVFLQVEGSSNEAIIVDGGDLSKAQTPLAFKQGAESTNVKLRA